MGAAFEYEAHGLSPSATRPAIPDGPASVANVLDRVIATGPGRDALVGRHARYTYAELDRAANRAAQALVGLGIGPWDRVAVSLGNYSDLVVAFLATMRLGAIWVGVNRPLAAREKAYILRDAGVKVFLGSVEMAAQVDSRRSDLPALSRVVRVEPGSASCEWAALVEGATNEARPTVEIDPYAPAAIAYTSGTSGFPKGAVHSQHNILLPGAVTRASGEHPTDTRHGCILPLTILNLMVLQPVLAFQSGSCCVCIDRIDAAGLAGWIRDERVGHFAGVPTILHDLLTHPDVRPEDVATLRRPLVGGADTPPALQALYRERFGSEVIIGYGMTEAPTAVTATDGTSAPTPGGCGRALPQVDVHVVDEHDRDLPAGEVGEVCVAPASAGEWAGIYTPMLGYWNKPEVTDEALRGGRYHTGDLGCLDADGVLTIRGRRSDLIIRGGANVYPAEVERILLEDERVDACAVLGIPDERLGERVVAAIQLAGGASTTTDELRARCAESLARYKVPDELFFVDELPRNAMGKIVKHELAKQLGR